MTDGPCLNQISLDISASKSLIKNRQKEIISRKNIEAVNFNFMKYIRNIRFFDQTYFERCRSGDQT